MVFYKENSQGKSVGTYFTIIGQLRQLIFVKKIIKTYIKITIPKYKNKEELQSRDS